MRTNKFTIADLKKVIKFAEAQHAAVVVIREDLTGPHSQLKVEIQDPSKGKSYVVTVFCAESSKMPEVTKSETLF